MSDSEDEAAFASADEGEGTQKKASDKTGAGDAATAAVVGAASSGAASTKKDQAQSKNQKKKGKKGGQKKAPASTKTSEKTEVTSSAPVKTAVTSAPRKSKVTSAPEEVVPASVKTEAKSDATKVSKSVEVKSKDDKPLEGNQEKVDHKKPEKDETKAAQTSKSVDSRDDVSKSPETKDDVKTTDSSQKSAESTERKTPDRSSPPEVVTSPDPQQIPRAEGTNDEQPKEEAQAKESGGGWGWGNWGSSLISAASSSVTAFTSQVGEGFHTIVESVESSLGAPPPEEIARLAAEDEKSLEEEKDGEATEETKGETTLPGSESSGETVQAREVSSEAEVKEEEKGGGWFSSMGVSNLTSKIQNTGKSFVSGSLDAVEALATGSIDVLENIGKKTIHVLSDHDPGFKKTKEMMFHKEQKQSLSTLLREAKESTEKEAVLREEEEEAWRHNFGAVFDDFQGLAHLEALEILSNQSEKKVQALLSSLSDDIIDQLKPQLIKLKDIFELDDSDFEERQEHEFAKLITDHLSELHLGTTPDKLNKVQEKHRQWIVAFYADPSEGEEKAQVEPKEVLYQAIEALAEITAKSVEQFHKAGELVLLQQDSDTCYNQRAKSLASLTQVLCTEVSILSTKFTQCLHKVGEDQEDPSVITPLVTNVYLEASNSSTYIQDGFQLLLPVLQQAAIQNSDLIKS